MRLDSYLFDKGYFNSRNKAAEACERGEVTVDGVVRVKPSFDVNLDAQICISGKGYVSLGAYKLEKAIEQFNYDCNGKVFADIGASTGGFTQCLLIGGASKVYAVDVGEGLLDERLVADDRVVVMDDCNARYLKKSDFADNLDGITVDCSFISLKTLLPVLKNLIDESASIIALIKPQFECGKKSLGKSGILLDNKRLIEVLTDIYAFCQSEGLTVANFTYSPINKKKNLEFLILLDYSGKNKSLKFIVDVAEDAVGNRK